MKKIVSLIFSFLISPILLNAQDVDTLTVSVIDTLPAVVIDTAWEMGGDININFSQVSLSNWAGGGQSSISLGNILNLFANYDKGKDLWNSKLKAAYGLIRQGKGEDQPIRKSDDLLVLETQYGRRFSKNWLVSVLLNLRTQFYKGVELKEQPDGGKKSVLVSEFMSPAYLQAALGATYKRSDVLIFTLSPFTSKNTIVFNDNLAPLYQVREGKNIRAELGTSADATLKKEIIKNIKFETSLNLFSNYNRIKNVDVNWTTHLVLKVNKYITSSVTTQLIYDDDIDVPRDDELTSGPATQFKSAINIGFIYSFD